MGGLLPDGLNSGSEASLKETAALIEKINEAKLFQ